MAFNWFAKLKPRHHRPLQDALSNRLLTGLYIDADRLYLRFVDATVSVDLLTREYQYGRDADDKVWLSLVGWVRVGRVIEEQSQLILEVSGALYSARIHARHTDERWFLIFSGGRSLASA